MHFNRIHGFLIIHKVGFRVEESHSLKDSKDNMNKNNNNFTTTWVWKNALSINLFDQTHEAWNVLFVCCVCVYLLLLHYAPLSSELSPTAIMASLRLCASAPASSDLRPWMLNPFLWIIYIFIGQFCFSCGSRSFFDGHRKLNTGPKRLNWIDYMFYSAPMVWFNIAPPLLLDLNSVLSWFPIQLGDLQRKCCVSKSFIVGTRRYLAK